MIRGKTLGCPYGLAVPAACSSVGGQVKDAKGSVVFEMISINNAETKEEAEKITDSNLELMLMIDKPARCPFADLIIEDSGSVDCKFDPKQTTIPAGNVGLNGSPLYPHIMIGNMPEAQYGYPLDYYSDNNESRNVYYGLYSLVG